MSSRDAIDTITGYFYQFDKSILELLKQEDENASVCIEGIEDIDVVTEDEVSAIQCKYYAKTEYNHSVIKKPIILMLKHFAENINSGIKYYLYGHYQSGHEKLIELNVKTLKADFLTYRKAEKSEEGENVQVTHLVYEELDLNDEELNSFLKLLTVDIHAPSFEVQYQNIIVEIKENLNVSDAEAELYHYNSALKLIKNLSIKQSNKERSITKINFINKINKRDELFDTWFIRRKGREKYIKALKKECFSTSLNMEAFERFFLLDCCDYEDLYEIKESILVTAAKWSKTSLRQKPRFCPSIYLHNLSLENIVRLKNMMSEEGVSFWDAFPFKGSKLNSKHFFTEPNSNKKVIFRFIDSLDDLKDLIDHASRTVEIYQFYKDSVYYENERSRHQKIKIETFNYIKELTK